MTDWTPHAEQRAHLVRKPARQPFAPPSRAIEREAGSEASFRICAMAARNTRTNRRRRGTRGLMKGKVFEKVGVNVSTVHGGAFSPEFAAIHSTVLRAEDRPGFTATGISLVAHMANPARPRRAHEHPLPDD
jgi:coproporphyrinogen III oxidase